MLLTLKLRKQNVTNKQSCDVSRKSLRPQDGNLVDDHKRRYNFVIIDVVDCMPESHHWHNMVATWRKCDACVLRATQRTTQESGFQRRLKTAGQPEKPRLPSSWVLLQEEHTKEKERRKVSFLFFSFSFLVSFQYIFLCKPPFTTDGALWLHATSCWQIYKKIEKRERKTDRMKYTDIRKTNKQEPKHFLSQYPLVILCSEIVGALVK